MLVLPLTFLSALGELKPVEGYSPNIDFIVSMSEDLKDRIIEQVKDSDRSQTDFMYDDKANSIGTLIMHFVSRESYYQVATLEKRD